VQHHGRSDFSAPPRHQLDEAAARQVMKAFYALRDFLWRNRGKGEQRIPDSRRRVLKYLLDVAVKAGQVFPSQATIAKHAGCCERTVRNALAWLRENGFLTWQRRLEWAPNELGQRMPRQVSNAYTIALEGLAKIGAAVLNLGSNGKKFRVAQNSSPFLKQQQEFVAQKNGAG
jgi:Helix-turn-helix domain